MTRNLTSLFLVLLFACSPRHITKQSQLNSVVTLCDKYYGQTSKNEIKTNPKLQISNNRLNWTIISFNYSTIIKGGIEENKSNESKLPECFLNKLDTLPDKFRLYIDEIKAVNKIKDTLILNSITLTVFQK
jgi:hypothetical protein